MTITLQVATATLVERNGHGDVITIDLDDETSRAVHGDNLQYRGCASLQLNVLRGRGRTALLALGIDRAVVINIDKKTHTEEQLHASAQ